LKRPINIGHRGHEAGIENTLESFSEAIDLGADMIELDVWLSGDGVPVVYHDEFLVLEGENLGRIAQHTVEELDKFALPGGAKIPTLETVLLEFLPRVSLNIELKFYDLNYRPLVSAFLRLVRQVEAEEKILVSSFFHQSLEIVNRAEPKLATAPIFGTPTGPPHEHDLEKLAKLPGWPGQIGIDRPAAVVDYLMLSGEVVADFKNSKLALVAYTVDDVDTMRRMTDLGVEGIVTNRPAVLRQLLNEYA
jgi:glycerophosphoryl diester phosphodiesterase